MIEPMPNRNMKNTDIILLQRKLLYFSERTSIFKVQYQSQKNNLYKESTPLKHAATNFENGFFFNKEAAMETVIEWCFLFETQRM